MKEGGSTSEHKVVNAVITSLENVTTASRRIELSDKTPESAHHVQIKAPSLTLLSTFKDEDKQSIRDSPYMKEGENISKEKAVCTTMHSFENETTTRRVDVLEKTPELISSKETTLQEGGLLLEEVQEKMQSGGHGNKKKNKRHLHADMLSGVFSDLGNGNCAGMPLSAYNSYWTAGGTPWVSHGCMMPLFGSMPYTGYIPSLYGIPLEGIYPQYSLGPQGYKLSAAPQRDLSELGIKSWTPTQGPPVMNTAESEPGKYDMRKKHKINQLNESCREYSLDREMGREWCSHADASSLKSNPRPLSHSSDMKVASWDHHGEGKTDYHDHNHQYNNRRLKTIASSNRDESSNKRKLSELPNRSSENHPSHRPKANNFQDDHKPIKSTESSEECHFKRRPSWSRDEREDDRRHSGRRRERQSS